VRKSSRRPISEALRTALRCRCPRCGRGKLFRSWFNLMLPRCPFCGLPYFRESGYYVGGMIFSYGITAAVLLIIWFASMPFPDVKSMTDNERLGVWIVIALAVNLASVRHAYSLWLSIDYWLEPWSPDDPMDAL
jgi:uncharacterized protein (DUF983 family)